MDSTSLTLLDRLKHPGDAAAWDRFVQLYTPLLYHWLRCAGFQEADAAELVQDVFAVLVSRLPEWDSKRDKSFHGWLRTVTMNRWRDLKKRAALVKSAGSDSAAQEAIVPDPLETFIEREYRDHLALDALRIMKIDFSPETFEAFWDLVVGGESAPRVAKKHGMTVGCVYADKCRVLARLRRELLGLWV